MNDVYDNIITYNLINSMGICTYNHFHFRHIPLVHVYGNTGAQSEHDWN